MDTKQHAAGGATPAGRKYPKIDAHHEYMAQAHCSWGRARTVGAARLILSKYIGRERAADARIDVVPKGARISDDGMLIEWKRENHPGKQGEVCELCGRPFFDLEQ